MKTETSVTGGLGFLAKAGREVNSTSLTSERVALFPKTKESERG